MKQNTDKDATSVRNATALTALKSKWRDAATVFASSNDHRVLQTHRQDSDSDLGVDSVRMCARNQVLEVDPLKMAGKLLDYALEGCKARNLPIKTA